MLEKGRTIKQHFSRSARICSVLIALCLFFLWFLSAFDASRTMFAIILYCTPVILALTSIATLFIMKRKMLSQKVRRKPARKRMSKSTASTIGVTSGAAGAMFSQYGQQNLWYDRPEISAIIVAAFLPLALIYLTVFATIIYYGLCC